MNSRCIANSALLALAVTALPSAASASPEIGTGTFTTDVSGQDVVIPLNKAGLWIRKGGSVLCPN